MDKKSIWCISKYGSPPKYGVGARLFYIANEFTKYGAEVLFISSDSNHLAKYPETKQTYNVEKYGNLSYVWIKTLKYTNSASIRRILSWFDFEFKLFGLKRNKYKRPDIVIISSLSMLSIVYGIYLKKLYGCKLIFEVRDIYPLTLTAELGVSKWNPLVLFLGFIEKIGYRKSDLIVGTMPNLRAHVKNILGRDREVFHSPIGIHELWYRESRINSAIDSLFPSEDHFVVGYAGSIGVSNALDAYVEAIERLSDDKNIYFVIVGDGDLKEKYSKKLSSFKNVKIGPKIAQNDIPYFLSKCDLLYLSTHDSVIWEYGQSMNKVVDYMMAGKPVVASYSGYQSMLNEANSGIFVPSGDVDSIIEAVRYFMQMDADERKLYGTRGREWIAEHNSYNNISKKYFERIMEF